MLRHLVRLSASHLAILLLAESGFAQVSLVWKFAPGSSFNLERVYRQKQVIEAKGKTFKQDSSNTWLSRIVVKKLIDKEIVLEQTIVSVTATSAPQTAPGADSVLTSRLTEKMKGSVFQVIVTPDGRVRKFAGYDDMLKKMSDGNRDLEKSLRFLIPEAALRDGLEEALGFLPEKPIQPKDRWQRQAVDPVPPFGALKTIFHYTYQGRQGDADVIAYTLETTFAPSTQDLGLIRVIKGTLQTDDGKGTVYFDRDKGMLIRGEKQLRIRGNLTLETAGKTVSNLEFSSENTLRWRILDEKQQD
jgi:hypothetical protein